MKKPNLILLLSVACLGLLGTALTAAADPAPAPDTAAPAVSSPSPSPATPVNPVPLAVTPAAILNQPGLYNLARWYSGSGIVVMQPDGEPKTLSLAEHDLSPFSTLLDQDATAPTPINAGSTRIIIDFGAIKLIKRVGFFSLTANGTVDVYYTNSQAGLSPDSTRWMLTNARSPIAPNTPVDIALEPLSARYLMLAFNTTTPGNIASLAIFAQRPLIGKAVAPVQPGVNGVPATTTPAQKAEDFDFGPSAFGSRVTHIAGGNVSNAQNVLDGNTSVPTVLGQDANSDNILVVDLGATREVNKLGLLFNSKGPGNLEFYMIDDLPASLKKSTAAATKTAALFPSQLTPSFLLAATAGSLGEALALAQLAQSDNAAVKMAYLPPDFFTSYKPIFVKHVNGDEQHLSEKFDKLPCRYLIIRWVPDNPANQTLSLFHLNLIGPVPEDAYAEATTDYQFSSATSTGGSNGGGTAAGGGSGGTAGGGSGGGGGEGPGPPPPTSP